MICTTCTFLNKWFKSTLFQISSIQLHNCGHAKKGIEIIGNRKSDQEIQISLPDFEKSDIKRMLDIVYKRECLIENKDQLNSLVALCELLGLNLLNSDLEYGKEKIEEETDYDSNDPHT